MVHMKNIRKKGSIIQFDGYINGRNDRHFYMTIDINDLSNSTASIELDYHTDEAQMKIIRTLARDGKLPSELVAMSH